MCRLAEVPVREGPAIACKAHSGRDRKMVYLIVQLLPYLMLVFAIGMVVGWSSAGK